jgi:LacI family transcriptional regulator
VSAVLAEHGGRPEPPVPCGFDESAGGAAARRVLARRRRPDALVCANDEVALGALLAAEEIGLRVPDDLAVTGWDDVMAARYSRPALTTVRQPMRQLGARAATVLDERINGTRKVPQHDLLPTELVVRASCGHH